MRFKTLEMWITTLRQKYFHLLFLCVYLCKPKVKVVGKTTTEKFWLFRTNVPTPEIEIMLAKWSTKATPKVNSQPPKNIGNLSYHQSEKINAIIIRIFMLITVYFSIFSNFDNIYIHGLDKKNWRLISQNGLPTYNFL